jgi:hypothetical protein
MLMVVTHLDAFAAHRNPTVAQSPRSFDVRVSGHFVVLDRPNSLNSRRNVCGLEKDFARLNFEMAMKKRDAEAIERVVPLKHVGKLCEKRVVLLGARFDVANVCGGWNGRI